MQRVILLTAVAVGLGCGRTPAPVRLEKAVHTATARDTAFVRANCAMPDSVLAGTKPCIDRAQTSNIRVF
jgi:hypothetical protein